MQRKRRTRGANRASIDEPMGKPLAPNKWAEYADLLDRKQRASWASRASPGPWRTSAGEETNPAVQKLVDEIVVLRAEKEAKRRVNQQNAKAAGAKRRKLGSNTEADVTRELEKLCRKYEAKSLSQLLERRSIIRLAQDIGREVNKSEGHVRNLIAKIALQKSDG